MSRGSEGTTKTAPCQKAIRKRSIWVEPLFGEAKQWHGLRRFRLRRLRKVTGEALLRRPTKFETALSKARMGAPTLPTGAPGLRSRTDRSLNHLAPSVNHRHGEQTRNSIYPTRTFINTLSYYEALRAIDTADEVA